jgi:hypothetical protein
MNYLIIKVVFFRDSFAMIKKIKFFRKFSKAMASEYGFHSFPVVD